MTSRTRVRLEAGLWGGTVVLGAAGILRADRAAAAYQVRPRVLVDRVPDARLRGDSARADSVHAAVDALDGRDPFVLEDDATAGGPRVDASMGMPPSGIGPVAPRGPQPTLVLSGVVGVAPALRAVVDGIPGVDGSALLAAGDTLRGFRVRRVTADSAVVQGADSVWRLALRRSWP